VPFDKDQYIIAFGQNPLDRIYYDYDAYHSLSEHGIINDILKTDGEVHLYINTRKHSVNVPWMDE
jgi:hypothetical protein